MKYSTDGNAMFWFSDENESDNDGSFILLENEKSEEANS